VGSISEYSLTEDWTRWFERLMHYFIGNDVPKEKQVSLFITLLGNEGYDLLCNLCTPESPANLTLEQLAKMMQNHLQPQPSVISQRYKFKECKQLTGEDIKTYLTKLKKLSIQCNFGGQLEDHLRDQLVWGVSNEKTKKRLLGEQHLTYTRAVEISTSLEMAEREATDMGEGTTSTNNALNFIFKKDKVESSESKNNKSKIMITCFCCGKKGHKVNECRFRNLTCNACRNRGHLETVCKLKTTEKCKKCNCRLKEKTKANNKRKSQNNYVEESEDSDESLNNLCCNKINIDKAINNIEPLKIELKIGNTKVSFEIDTGSAITALSELDFNKLKVHENIEIRPTKRRFKSYTGDKMVPISIANVTVTFKHKMRKLQMYILSGNSAPIIGRDWLHAFKLIQFNNKTKELTIKAINNDWENDIFQKFKSLFSTKLGLYTKKKFKLHLKENTIPVFCKPKPIPFALRDKVEKKLDRLIQDKILEPIKTSEWATPIVPVPKSDGQIRICGNYKITLNPHLRVDRYPIPRVSELLTKLNKGVVFTKLDLAQAYQQVELEEESKALVTITTHKGLFKCNRLSYGIASAPGLFQREMESILQRIDNVGIFFDDVVITGATPEEHDKNVLKVLQKLQDCGLTLRKEKCKWAQKSIEFLGFELGNKGI